MKYYHYDYNYEDISSPSQKTNTINLINPRYRYLHLQTTQGAVSLRKCATQGSKSAY